MAALAWGSRELPRRGGVWGLLKGEEGPASGLSLRFSCTMGFPSRISFRMKRV